MCGADPRRLGGDAQQRRGESGMDSALGSSPHRVRVERMGPTGGSHRSVTQGMEAVRDLLRAADPVRLRGGDGEGGGVARMRSCRVARAGCAASWAAAAERGGRGDGPAGEGRPAGPGWASKEVKEKKIFSPFQFKGLLIVL